MLIIVIIIIIVANTQKLFHANYIFQTHINSIKHDEQMIHTNEQR